MFTKLVRPKRVSKEFLLTSCRATGAEHGGGGSARCAYASAKRSILERLAPRKNRSASTSPRTAITAKSRYHLSRWPRCETIFSNRQPRFGLARGGFSLSGMATWRCMFSMPLSVESQPNAGIISHRCAPCRLPQCGDYKKDCAPR